MYLSAGAVPVSWRHSPLCFSFFFSFWSWLKAGRHGSGHRMDLSWNIGSATYGMCALGSNGPRSGLQEDTDTRADAGQPGRKFHFQLNPEARRTQLPWGWFAPKNSLLRAAKQRTAPPASSWHLLSLFHWLETRHSFLTCAVKGTRPFYEQGT